MKKIYSFILTALLLLGTSNVWGTYYLMHGWNNIDNWYFQELQSAGDGTYYCYGIYGNTGGTTYGLSTQKDGDNVTYNIPQDTQGATIAAGTYCKFSINPTAEPKKVFVSEYTGTMHSVTISTGSKSAYLYAWNANEGGDGFKYDGQWPGYNNSTSHTINVPDGCDLEVIFNSGDGTQSNNIHLGTISSTSSFTLTIGDNYQPEGFLSGDFCNWEERYDYRWTSGSVTVNLPIANHDYQVKPIYYGTWFGKDHSTWFKTLTPSSSSEAGLYEKYDDAPSNPIKIHTTISGDYTFTWANETKTLSVTYPDKYTRPAANGAWGTICLPVAASIPSNATFYQIIGLRSATENESEATSNPYSIIIESVDALSAGVPYIFNMTGSGGLSITLNNNNYTGEAGSANGLHGTYDDTTISANYVLTSAGEIQAAATTGCSVSANRAYINIEGIEIKYSRSAVVSAAPGRRIIEASLESNTTTPIDNVEANEKAVKFFENGQMYILRNGVTYDMTGRAVK